MDVAAATSATSRAPAFDGVVCAMYQWKGALSSDEASEKRRSENVEEQCTRILRCLEAMRDDASSTAYNYYLYVLLHFHNSVLTQKESVIETMSESDRTLAVRAVQQMRNLPSMKLAKDTPLKLDQVVLPKYDDNDGIGMDRSRNIALTSTSIIVYNWYEVMCIDRETLRRRWQRTLKEDIRGLATEASMNVRRFQDTFIKLRAEEEFLVVVTSLGWMLLDIMTGVDMFDDAFVRMFYAEENFQEWLEFGYEVCKNKRGHECLIIHGFNAETNPASPNPIMPVAALFVVQPEACSEAFRGVSGISPMNRAYAHDYFDPSTGQLSENVPPLRRRYTLTHKIDLIPWCDDEQHCDAILQSPRINTIKRAFWLARPTSLSLVLLHNGLDPQRNVVFNFEPESGTAGIRPRVGERDSEGNKPYLCMLSNVCETFTLQASRRSCHAKFSTVTVGGNRIIVSYIELESQEYNVVYEVWNMDIVNKRKCQKLYRWREQWVPCAPSRAPTAPSQGGSFLDMVRNIVETASGGASRDGYAIDIKECWYREDWDDPDKHVPNMTATRDLFNPLAIRTANANTDSGNRMFEYRTFRDIQTSRSIHMFRWCTWQNMARGMPWHVYCVPNDRMVHAVHMTKSREYLYLFVDDKLLVVHLKDDGGVETIYEAPVEMKSNDENPTVSLADDGALILAYNLEHNSRDSSRHIVRVAHDMQYETRYSRMAQIVLQTKEWD